MPAFLFQGDGEVSVAVGALRRQADHLPELRDGAVVVVLVVAQHFAEGEARENVAGLEANGLLEGGGGFVEGALGQQGGAEVGVGQEEAEDSAGTRRIEK